MPSFEPLFASLALFDVSTRERLSENFYIDIPQLSGGAAAQCAREACVRVRDGTIGANTIILVRVEKILSAADVAEAVEPYVASRDSGGNVDERTRERLAAQARDYTSRLAAYKQLIGWNFIHVHTLLREQLLRRVADATTGASDECATASGATRTSERLADTDSIISAGNESKLKMRRLDRPPTHQ